MGFRFRKSFKIAPGVKLNIGKKSAGVSVGGKGFSTSVSSSGRKTTSVGVPGTGLSYVSSSGGSSKSKSSKGSASSMSSSKKGGCWLILVPIIIILIIISGIRSCVGGDNETTTVASATGIESIEFKNAEPVNLFVGDSDEGYVKVELNRDLEDEDIVFVSSDDSVVAISLSSTTYSFAYYDLEAVGAGTATIHAESSDGVIKSELITVTVIEEETTTKEESESTTKEEIKTTENKIETTKKEVPTEKKTESANAPVSDTKYVLNTSTSKIHYKSCSSVKDIASHNYAETDDYDGAIADGYSPCGRCNP